MLGNLFINFLKRTIFQDISKLIKLMTNNLELKKFNGIHIYNGDQAQKSMII